MKYYYDFHIHSCLSPCSDDEMTPHSIAGMSYINGLDIIAVADHNTARNIRATSDAAQQYGVLVVPGIEAETAENIHVLCLFPDIETAESFGMMLEEHLPPIKNRPDIFGHQHIMNQLDEKVGEIEKLLINATDITIEEMKKKVEEAGGVCIAAHIDRESNGIRAILGCVPDELNFSAVELSGHAPDILERSEKYIYIKDSDAHKLINISEKTNFLELEEKSISAVIKKLS